MSELPEGLRVSELDADTQAARFFVSNNFVDYIQGDLGSGKTVTCCMRILRHVQEQWPSPVNGLRMSRWACVRNTNVDLKRTTIRTWLSICPDDGVNRFNWGQSLSHRLRFGNVFADIDFMGLDKEDDVRKLRSTEYTGIFFNELPFIEKVLFDESHGRLRYPEKKHGGPKWRGIIADGNAPPEDHWVALMTGQVDLPPGMPPEEAEQYKWPSDWGFFMQPPALMDILDDRGKPTGRYKINPNAENIHNLPDDYYDRLTPGKSRAWILSRTMNTVALVVDGSPVWPQFRREFHVANEVLKPQLGPQHTVTVSLDFGRVYPAALFSQRIGQRLYVQFELMGFNEVATQFAPRVKRFLESHYPGCPAEFTGDPKGNDKGQAVDISAYDVFAANGMPVTPAPVMDNNITLRTEAVAFALNDNPGGVNYLVISPYCRTLIVGMAGRYHLVREENGELKPKKDRYSNLCDCLQYLCLKTGEGRRMINLPAARPSRSKQVWKGRKSMRRVSA